MTAHAPSLERVEPGPPANGPKPSAPAAPRARDGESDSVEGTVDDPGATPCRNNENAVDSAPVEEGGSYEPKDPHPDTPDDLDDGACGRESEEAAPPEDP
jgi:hypothetical protein